MDIRDDAQGVGAAGARGGRVAREVDAARRLIASGNSEIEEVLQAAARALAADLERGGPAGVEEESAPAPAKPEVVVVHGRQGVGVGLESDRCSRSHPPA